jgi:hypothetical protein
MSKPLKLIYDLHFLESIEQAVLTPQIGEIADCASLADDVCGLVPLMFAMMDDVG